MIDLREYYLDNISEDDYYYRFFSLIEGVNRTYNVFYGEEETQGFEFLVHDEIEAIEKFRLLCGTQRGQVLVLCRRLLSERARLCHRAVPRRAAQASDRAFQFYIWDNQGQSRIAWARR